MSKFTMSPARACVDFFTDPRILSDMPVVLCTGVEPGLLFTRKVMLEQAGYTVLVAITQSELIQACKQRRVNVAVIGHEHNPDTKRQFCALVRRYFPLAKIVEVYPVELGKTLKSADAWIALPKQEPTELVECIAAVLKRRARMPRRSPTDRQSRPPVAK